ncbi:MAG: hypothetical protein ABFC63_08015 [Thermoguttaceae bacterium]
MARENQLLIPLIIFIGIAFTLGVTTYIGFHNYSDAAIKVKALTGDNSKLANDVSNRDEDIKKLKGLIGVPATENMEGVRKLFDEDKTKFGAGYPEESLYYRPLLEKLKKTIDERNNELKDVKQDVQKLQDQYKVREEAKAPQLKKFEEERDKASKDLAAEQNKFKGERDRKNEEQAKLQADVQKIRDDAKKDKEVVIAELEKTKTLNKKLQDLVEAQSLALQHITGSDKRIEAASGKVIQTNQHDGTVWIDLGRADSLMRQVTFSVYPADLTNMTVKNKKGSIEVTQILGDHLAEARVIDDSAKDPILPGDKIHTVLWSPGQQRHFALAGFMDLDGDGRSDLATVVNLIRSNGGVIDAFIPENGEDKNKVKGEITVNTNCLVVGIAPNEKGDLGQLAAFSKMTRDASQLRIPTMQLGDLLQAMGWRNLSPVVRYGRDSNPNDFRALPADGEQRTSTGSHSDAFEKREPAPASQQRRTPSNSYYRF